MARQPVTVVSVFFTLTVGSLAASPLFTPIVSCPEGQFYDHGTELCEPCAVICSSVNEDIAVDPSLVEECLTLCPATYAQLTSKQERPELSVLSAPKDHSSATSPNNNSNGPNLALVIGILSGVVVISFLVILGAYVCKRAQENTNSGPTDGSSRQQAGTNITIIGSNRSRQGYRPAGVQEENGAGAGAAERRAASSLQGNGPPRSYCDPRHWFSAAEEVPAEETESGRQGTQEIALLGNSHGSVVQQDLSQPKTVIATPIYKPSGSMRSTRI